MCLPINTKQLKKIIKYKSKFDFGILFIIIISFMPVILVLYYDFSWLVTILFGVIFILTLILFFGISYIIDGTKLYVKSAFIGFKAYDISEMTEIRQTNTFLASPAASLDRIEIKFRGTHERLIISPRKKDDFIEKIKMINADIIVKL